MEECTSRPRRGARRRTRQGEWPRSTGPRAGAGDGFGVIAIVAAAQRDGTAIQPDGRVVPREVPRRRAARWPRRALVVPSPVAHIVAMERRHRRLPSPARWVRKSALPHPFALAIGAARSEGPGMHEPPVSPPAAAPLARARANAEPLSLAGARASNRPVPDLVAAFLSGRRSGTRRAYARALSAFATWSGASSPADAAEGLLGGSLGDANRTVFAYRAALLDAGLARATVGLRLTALRTLVRLARMQGLVSWELEVEGVRREPYRDTRGPGRRGVRALLAEVEGPASPKGVRDRAILRLLLDLALRRAEVTTLDVADVDLAEATVAVVGKGRSLRSKLTLPDTTRDALDAWIAVRGPEPGALFTSFDRSGKRTRLTGTSLARLVRRIGEAAGIPNLHPHALRHAAITSALDLTCGDVRAVQRFSRHADPRTLLLYDDCRRDRAGEVARLVSAWR